MSELLDIKPADIEKRSFEIIGDELKKLNVSFDEKTDPIMRRVIHTSADFDYVNTMRFSDGAIDKAIELLKSGADIVTDTNMAFSGINKNILKKLGGEAHCFMADEDVARLAKERGITRAVCSIEKASKLEKPVIFAIGNAPTALLKLHEMIKNNEYRPAFIIGVPVGFVNVEISKELIIECDVPYIVNIGRKGGSNIAAAIVNALLYSIRRD